MGYFIEQPLKEQGVKQMILTKFGFVKQKPQEEKDNKAAYQFAKRAAQNEKGVDQNILESYKRGKRQ